MSLAVVPVDFDEACAFVEQRHRHHQPPAGCKFCIATAWVENGASEIRGVLIAGRPVARGNQDGWTLEVTRCATDGTRNACSMLYRAAWKAARALGYRRLITYTLPEEGGASLRGAAFRLVGERGGGSWNCQSRPRVDKHPTQGKLLWEIT